jgi:hypothetical protein
LAKDISKMSIDELKAQIKRLSDMGESEAAEKYQDELNKKQSKSSSVSTSGGVSQDDWDAAGSKYAKEGLHKAEFYAGEWKNTNVSVLLKFVISDDNDEDNGKEGELWPGIGPSAIFRFKEICKALGIEPVFKSGALDVVAMFPKFAGKVGMVHYAPKKTNKGNIIITPLTVYKVGAELPEEAPF